MGGSFARGRKNMGVWGSLWVTRVGLCPSHCVPGGVHRAQELLHREVVAWHCSPLVRLPWLIPADGNSVWNGAENVLIFVCLPFDGGSAACTLAVRSQWTMSHGRCASFTSFPMVFYHSLILLIFSLFEAQGLDVFQLPLKWDMKTLQPVQKFKPLIHPPWKGFGLIR